MSPATEMVSEQREWDLRRDLAAVFRIGARLGWNEQIGNHNSLMLPGGEELFLINPRGLLFQEITASSLIPCTLDGKVVRGTGELREVAFHIHTRIHRARPDAACVVHTHTVADNAGHSQTFNLAPNTPESGGS